MPANRLLPLLPCVAVLLFALASQSSARTLTPLTPLTPLAPQAASGLHGLTFVRGQSLTNRYIMRIRADGSVMRFLRGFAPAWSPDGRELAYIVLRPTPPGAGMESDLVIVSADGRQRRRLTNDPSQETDIEWSPAGAQIAYSDGVSGSGAGDIFVADHGGRHHRRLTRTRSICEYPTGWSADGRWVQVSTCVTGARFELRARDGTKRPPSTPRGSLSPDGRSVAYLVRDGDDHILYLADTDGGNPRRIGPVSGSGLEWSPDGQLLAFEGDARNGCGATEYRAQVFVIAPQPGSIETPRNCTAAWDRSPTWQTVRR